MEMNDKNNETKNVEITAEPIPETADPASEPVAIEPETPTAEPASEPVETPTATIPAIPPAKIKKHFSKIGWVFLLQSLLMFGLQMLLLRVIQVLAPGIGANYDMVLVLVTIGTYLITIPLMVRLLKNVPKTEIPVQKMKFVQWVVAFLMSYTLMYVSNLLGLYVTNFIGNVTGTPVENPVSLALENTSPWAAMIVMVIVAPLVEEYIFRKLLVDRVVVYGEGVAVVLSGLMFGAMHGNLNQFAYAFGLGCFFAFIYLKTGKLRYSIFLHAAINFMGSVPGLLVMNSDAFEAINNVGDSVEEVAALMQQHGAMVMGIYLYTILAGILVVAGLVFWILKRKKLKCAPGLFQEMGMRNGKKLAIMVVNAGMICYFLFWIVQMIQQALGL